MPWLIDWFTVHANRPVNLWPVSELWEMRLSCWLECLELSEFCSHYGYGHFDFHTSTPIAIPPLDSYSTSPTFVGMGPRYLQSLDVVIFFESRLWCPAPHFSFWLKTSALEKVDLPLGVSICKPWIQSLFSTGFNTYFWCYCWKVFFDPHVRAVALNPGP